MSDLQFSVGHAPGNLAQCPCPECAGRRMDERIQRCETAIERICEILRRIDNKSSAQKYVDYVATDIELIRQYIRRDF